MNFTMNLIPARTKYHLTHIQLAVEKVSTDRETVVLAAQNNCKRTQFVLPIIPPPRDSLAVRLNCTTMLVGILLRPHVRSRDCTLIAGCDTGKILTTSMPSIGFTILVPAALSRTLFLGGAAPNPAPTEAARSKAFWASCCCSANFRLASRLSWNLLCLASCPQ
jgi:hypothetical protein